MKPVNRLRDLHSVNTGNKGIGHIQIFAFVTSWQKLFYYIPPILLFCILSSCAPESCIEDTNAFVKVSFYLNKDGKRVAPDSLTLFGLGMETNKLYEKARGVQPALLPLDPAAENSIFIISINGITDTISLTYNSFPHLISKECGYSFYHKIDTPSGTNHAIGKIRIMNRNITTLNEENIRIYY